MENSNAALTLEERFALLEKLFNDQVAESTAKDAVIEAQDLALKAANAQGASALSVFTHEKKAYQVLAGQFSIDGKLITHEQLKADAELAQLVVEKYPDLVQVIEEK